MLCPSKRQKRKYRHRKRPCEDRGRDWSDAVKSQGMPEPPEAVRSKEAFSPRDFGSVAMPTS